MWLVTALLAYFLFAAVVTIDRHLLTSAIPNPFSYAFYVGLFAGVALILAPFFFVLPPGDQTLFGILSGVTFMAALIAMYHAFQVGEVSRAAPAIGAVVAIVTFSLARIILSESLNPQDFFAFFLLVAGGFLISFRFDRKEFFNRREASFILIAGICFALSWVLRKELFLHQPFIGAFLWVSGGMVLSSFFLFCIPKWRREILSRPAKTPTRKKMVFVANQMMSGVAGILLNVSVFFGSVTLVNALQGAENLFIFLFTFTLAKKFPSILKEEFHGFVMWQKGIAVALIAIGLYLLSKNVL